jgi:hypothetical protein
VRFTIAVDFDGVIHQYRTGWKNSWTIPDPPVEGAITWLLQMAREFDVVIYSTRCRSLRGRLAIRRWLREHAGNAWYESPAGPGLEDVKLSAKKPKALLYVDDRGYRFTGANWPTAEQIRRLRPWNKP